MSNAAERLELCQAILALIDRKRAVTGDTSLGAGIERMILDAQIHELELEILENPGALESRLIRLRRGER